MPLVGSAEAVVDFMKDLGFDEKVITSVTRTLDQGSQAVERVSDFRAIDPASFGDLDEGYLLGDHTERARETVRQVLVDMVVGLERYREALVGLGADSERVEVDAEASFRKIQEAEACVAVPSFAAPGQCAPPSEEG